MINRTAVVTSTNLRSDRHVSTNTFRTEDILSTNGPTGQAPVGFILLPSAGTISGNVMTFHDHRRCAHPSFTTVFRMDMLRHCVGGQHPCVSNASAKALDSLRVDAGTTDERHAVFVLANAIHNRDSTGSPRGVIVMNITPGLLKCLEQLGESRQPRVQDHGTRSQGVPMIIVARRYTGLTT
jgi:hypothetical protein